MATEYHLTTEGPRPCAVDRSNPRSRGCPLGGTHFDSFDDAMVAYEEELRAAFGDFHVLVRPKTSEQIRRIGYRSMDAVEKTAASAPVRETTRALAILRQKAREALQEIREDRPSEEGRPSSLPPTVATAPLEPELPQEDREAEELSQEVFSPVEREDLADYSSRLLSRTAGTSFKMKPFDRTELDEHLARIRAAAPKPKVEPKTKSTAEILIAQKKAQRRRKLKAVGTQISRTLRAGAKRARAGVVAGSYGVRASGSLAASTVKLQAATAAARAQSGVAVAKKRAALMSIPASHIRPGDTFDGAQVRGVATLDDGRVQISYQVEPGGPILRAAVDGSRSMRVDRKTRREARRERVRTTVARPVTQVRALSNGVRKLSANQLSALRPIQSWDVRFGSIESSLRQEARAARQREIIAELKALRKDQRATADLQLH